jgi:hypothetical protein
MGLPSWLKTMLVGLVGLILTGPSQVRAQAISLSEKQRTRLVSIITSDREAKSLYERVRQQADEILNSEPHPLKEIQTSGKLQSDPVKIETQAGLRDAGKVFDLAAAFAVTASPVYGAKAKQFVLAWAKVNKPNGQPIDDTNLEPLLIGYDMVRKTFSDAERDQADKWLHKIAEAEISNRRPGSTSVNNWNSHRLKIVGLVGFAIGDGKLIKYATDGYKEQIRANLRPDGSTYDLEQRDALHYHCYDLEPLLTLARVAQLNGIDLYNYSSPKGASLAKSVRFALPYADGTKSHAEFVNSTVAFDRERGAAGERAYVAGRRFDPVDARRMIELDSFFDPAVVPLMLKLYGGTAQRYATFLDVFMDAEKQ